MTYSPVTFFQLKLCQPPLLGKRDKDDVGYTIVAAISQLDREQSPSRFERSFLRMCMRSESIFYIRENDFEISRPSRANLK